MPAYLVVNYDITDADAYLDYQSKAGPILTNGTLLVLDPASEGVEGEAGHQTVIIEYPTREAAEAAYRSPEYQAVVGIRHGATSNHRAMIVNGFAPPA